MTQQPDITEIVRRGPRIFIAWHKPIEADDHTIVVPPEDRCLVVSPDEPPDITKIASERHPGISRLARGVAAMLEAHEREPDGLRNSRRSVVKALFPHEAERITAILEGQRKPRINAGRLIRAAKKAGLTVERVESDQDGKVSVIIAKPGAASEPVSISDLDEWLAKRRKRAKNNADQS